MTENLEHGDGDGPARVGTAEPAPPLAETARWLAPFVRPELARLALVLVLSLGASLLALAQPWIAKLLIDDGLIAGDLGTVALLSAAMFAAALVAAALATLNRWHYVTASGRILFALRAALYRHLQALSPAYYAGTSGGEVMSRLDGDVAEVQRFAVDSALALVNGVIVLAGALALMVMLSPLLSLLAFVLLPAQILVLRALRPRIEEAARALRGRAGAISAFLFDTLSAMKFIQASAAEAREAERLERLQDGYLGELRRVQMLSQAATAIPGLIALLATIGVFLVGGALVIDGALTVGGLVAFVAYLARAGGPVNTLLGLWVAFKRAQVSLGRVHAITAVRPAVADPANPVPFAPAMAGEIVFDGVRFGHDPQAPVLDGVHARFPAGAKVVIAGASGAGKSTLIDLLQRHFDPDQGSIRLDGVDLRHLALRELRRRVAVVAQDTVLMPGTVAENIRYAAPEAGDAALAAALEAAGAAGFVRALPGGLDCQVGARGLRLSGGQRQRIAVARALLQDPLVLILDEATSGVDSATERDIADAVDRLFPGRTRIVIGHRSGLVAGADATFRLADGRLEAEPVPAP